MLFFTVKVTTPFTSEAPLAAEMVELPAPCPSVTALPGTGLPAAFFSVTVIVDNVVPSAGTEVRLATTVENDALAWVVSGPMGS